MVTLIGQSGDLGSNRLRKLKTKQELISTSNVGRTAQILAWRFSTHWTQQFLFVGRRRCLFDWTRFRCLHTIGSRFLFHNAATAAAVVALHRIILNIILGDILPFCLSCLSFGFCQVDRLICIDFCRCGWFAFWYVITANGWTRARRGQEKTISLLCVYVTIGRSSPISYLPRKSSSKFNF